MLFHDVVATGVAAAQSASAAKVKTGALVWAGVLIVLSASVGAFLGEKLAISRLAR